MATEVIFVRVEPAVKQAIEAQVEGLNKDRALGQPPHSINSFVLACIHQVLAFDADPARGDAVRKHNRKRGETARRKAAAARAVTK